MTCLQSLFDQFGYLLAFRKKCEEVLTSVRALAEASVGFSSAMNSLASSVESVSGVIEPHPAFNNAVGCLATTLRLSSCSVHQLIAKIGEHLQGPMESFVNYGYKETEVVFKKVKGLGQDFEVLNKTNVSTGPDPFAQSGGFEAQKELAKTVLDEAMASLQTEMQKLSSTCNTSLLRYFGNTVRDIYAFFSKTSDKEWKLEAAQKTQLDLDLTALGRDPVICSGHLKMPQVKKNEDFFFRLTSDYLTWYSINLDFNPANRITTATCTARMAMTGGTESSRCFQVFTPQLPKPLFLQASSKIERDRWMSCIQATLEEAINSQPVVKKVVLPRLDAVSVLKSVPGNDVCADCGAKDPDWSSINLGIILCLECCGIHRSFGTKISKVRSLTLDQWNSPELLLFMQCIGNSIANSIYESKPDSVQQKPTPADPNSEKWKDWLKAKYCDRSFVQPPFVSHKELNTQLYEICSAPESNVPMIVKLITQGADSNFTSSSDECRSCLHQSIIKGRPEHAEALLQRGAVVYPCDKRGFTPLHCAAFFNRPKCCALLLRHGLDAAVTDKYGNTALDIAVWNGSKETIDVLKDVVSNSPAGPWSQQEDCGAPPNTTELPPFSVPLPVNTGAKTAASTTTTPTDIKALPSKPTKTVPRPSLTTSSSSTAPPAVSQSDTTVPVLSSPVPTEKWTSPVVLDSPKSPHHKQPKPENS
ncbi:ArfGAP with coiled-coil, ankyrin repeat and PH domains 3 [Pelomyxa schiedti]|nr:ArfGAP with coiled-coil, ankyrin repeat and PH domains 3 [Pelomyxa schiedti]